MYRKSRRTMMLERKRARCAAMREAKERRRLEARAGDEGWRRIGTWLVAVYVSPDGERVEVHAHGGVDSWVRCGSERGVRAGLARLLRKDGACCAGAARGGGKEVEDGRASCAAR
jgi:hypothetical protein